MTERERRLWRAKLAAWCHDPPEKALVLMRDPAGHEGGTVAALCREVFGSGAIPSDLADIVKRADHWAAAADRPQFPREKDDRFARWAQVRFADDPVLIHPLTGQEFRLAPLDEPFEAIKNVSADHLKKLIHRDDGGVVDQRRTALTLWRFAPETPAPDLGAFWGLLPADTRLPDHSIFAHLDLASALAGAMAADAQETPALLSVSLGPVQDFIAQARGTSDLWAGSHLLSRLAWEGLKVICDEVGPDAVIYPQLRGVALVDHWLRDEVALDHALFEGEPWTSRGSDANPLFAAALPNRFVAMVPADAAARLAEEVTTRTRTWANEQANRALDKLIEVGGGGDDGPARQQIEAQFGGFPEVHWSVVPWSLAGQGDRVAVEPLRAALAVFHAHDAAPGFLGERVWRDILSHPIDVEGARFYQPNPGVLYPGLYDAGDRALAAAKTLRPFAALEQEGYRCSLCGEREWLTDDRALLKLAPGRRNDAGTLWTRVAAAKPAWAREGEHLCALCATKRLWPTLFVEDCRTAVELKIDRYVVSTHTMALASVLDAIIGKGAVPEKLAELVEQVGVGTRTALPARIDRLLRDKPRDLAAFVRGLPGYLDGLADRASEGDERAERDYEHAFAALKDICDGRAPEAYYAVLLMDGDEMGAWIAGDADKSIPFGDAFHPTVRAGMRERFAGDRLIVDYLAGKRPASPGRHMAISAALNAFAMSIAPRVVEGHFAGKLLYAGGDDLMALLPVGEALDAALMLRCAYSGTTGHEEAIDKRMKDLIARDRGGVRKLDNGFVMGPGKYLHRLMGAKATASAGLVVAHHKTPLAVVLRAVRTAEKRAKGMDGKNALSITLLKRAGGETRLTLPWGCVDGVGAIPAICLAELAEAFAGPLSRRAAYHTLAWIDGMPTDWHADGEGRAMVARLLAHQFKRQAEDKATVAVKKRLVALAEQVVAVAADLAGGDSDPGRRAHCLVDFLVVAEFLSRGGRTGAMAGNGEDE